MRARGSFTLCLTAGAVMLLSSAAGVFAQSVSVRGPSPSAGASAPSMPSRGPGGGGFNGGHRGPGFGASVPGMIMAIPSMGPAMSSTFVDDRTVTQSAPRQRPPQRPARRNGIPPASERRIVPDEVVIELANSVTQQQIQALQRRQRVTRIESQRMTLSRTTMYRWRIVDRRPVAAAVRDLQADRTVLSAQPNYQYSLQEDNETTGSKTEGDAAQYELAKLNLPQAHTLAKGDGIAIAVVDFAVDATHPELAGAIADSYDAVGTPITPDKHGTAIAGLIAAHGKLMGAAPEARILAVRAFSPGGPSPQGTTFAILKSIEWAVDHGARVINMSFAGPSDPAMERAIAAAHRKGVVLVAAAGNAGETSPPLYPAAYPNVIAVSGTDADDKIFAQSNRGRHIAIAAPGAQLLVAIPDGGYEVSSGTSYSAAEVSGIVALMLQHKPGLTPDGARAILIGSAKDIGPKGRDANFGAGLADAYGALIAEDAPMAAAPARRRAERVSTGAR